MIRIPVNSRRLKFLLCAALLVTISLSVWLFSGPGQGYGGGIEGNVLKSQVSGGDTDEVVPCAGVVIIIRDVNTNGFITKVTDENGYFRVHLVPGRYLVAVASEAGDAFLYGKSPEQYVGGEDYTRVTVYVSAGPVENRALPWRPEGNV